jgi:hypothetical protein
MKLILAISTICLSLAGIYTYKTQTAEPGVDVTSKVIVNDVVPFGVNLGIWTSWGAEQLSSNIVKNPGFEGVIDRAIVIPAHSGLDSFDDSTDWLGRAESFWDGGRYDVRTGPAAGATGKIVHSVQRNSSGLPSFILEAQSTPPFPGDAVSVTRESNGELPAQWWYNGPVNSFAPEPQQVRPGSPGERSLRISADAGHRPELISYFDSIGQRAGKLLPLGGHWELSFWTRLASGSATLRVQFGRDGAPPLLSKEVPLASGWVNQQISFEGSDEGPDHLASLRFQVSSGSQGQVLLDDVDLHRVSDRDSAFRHEVVAVLQELHPHYLRDWEGQLGDTLKNRLAPAFARKSFRYRPGDATQSEFGYGLPDFLELCLKTNANPWIIIPTTFSDDECAGLGTYLEKLPYRGHFSEIVTEFGNENWNELFKAAGISDPQAHGQAADRCFGNIRQHAPSVPLKTVVNAQHVNPPRAIEFARDSGLADAEAIAPYFYWSMSDTTTPDAALHAMYAGDGGALKKIAQAMPGLKKDLAVYEVNLTTISGNASGEQRTPIVAGRASAGALAKTMLDGLEEGVRRQCVYSLAGFDSQLPGEQGFVRLWGIARDLGPTSRLRPTGLALELLNQVVSGQMMRVDTHSMKDVSVYGFHSAAGWALAIVSMRDTPVRFDVRFPGSLDGPLPNQALSVASKFWYSTNEENKDVSIETSPVSVQDGRVSYEIQPWTLAVLRPGGKP